MQFLRLQADDATFPTLVAATGMTTLVADTYYAELNPNVFQWCGLHSIHWYYGTSLACTITVEGTNFYNADLLAATGAAGKWVDIASIADVVATGTEGQDLSSWADVGYGRMRAKIVVTVGGVLAGSFHSKKNS